MEGKRKKSGAENRNCKKARLMEEGKLSKVMRRLMSGITPALSIPHTSNASQSTLMDTPANISSPKHSSHSVNVVSSDIRRDRASSSSPAGFSDPALLIGKRLDISEKERIIKLGPYQPVNSVLNLKKRQFGKFKRSCSEEVFHHPDKSCRRWVSYSESKDALFCLPCILFTDAALRGENLRSNQGNSFSEEGFSNWKKQYSYVPDHKISLSHKQAVLAQAMFLH